MTSPRKLLTPVPFTQVHFEDAFWQPKLEINRTVTIPHNLEMLQQTGRIEAFDLKFERPTPAPIVLVFGDSDVAKWLEAASYALANHPDPQLEAEVDAVIARVAKAQQPDGYLNTHFIKAQPEMRWKNLRDWHELYCAGHLIEAGVAHFQATGKRSLLDVVCRYADHIDDTFGRAPGKKHGYCGHPEIELALIRLYHATGNQRYLNLSRYFVDERGQQPHYYDQEARDRGEDPADFWAKTYEYCQAQQPVREQKKIVGHAVRAMYLFSAVADLADETHDAALLETCQRLWDNLITKRMYVTGGIGPSRHNEGFTEDYDLPDESAYAETCATIGLMLWNHRLLQFEGDRKYADVFERALYNGFLSGVSLSGKCYFYENPLASEGHHHRQNWFDCPCCPPNIVRTLESLGQYVYSTGAASLWVHQYAQGTASVELDGQKVGLQVTTRYPWEGQIRITLRQAAPQRYALRLRIPGWCERWSVSVNGQGLAGAHLPENGYLDLQREWQDGDEVTLSLDMPVKALWANPNVRQLEGRCALQRGPLVYCVEADGLDAQGLDRIAIDPDTVQFTFHPEFQADLLGGVTVLKGQGRYADDRDWEGALYREQKPVQIPIQFTAIPYYAWDNRQAGEMRIWLRTFASSRV